MPGKHPVYSTARWRKLRAGFLAGNRVCVGFPPPCGQPSKVADHIVPLKKGGAAWSYSNLQPLCQACHNRKTARDTPRRKPKRKPKGPAVCVHGYEPSACLRCRNAPIRRQIEKSGGEIAQEGSK